MGGKVSDKISARDKIKFEKLETEISEEKDRGDMTYSLSLLELDKLQCIILNRYPFPLI